MLPEFSLIALQQSAVRDIGMNVLAGAIWAVLGWLFWKSFRAIQHLFRVSRAYYRINGGGRISAFYYVDDSKSCESGVFVLRQVSELFTGFYAQYPRSSVKPYHSAEVFILRRIQIPLSAQVKMLFHRPPFEKYDEVQKLYEAARKELPDPEPQPQPQLLAST